MANEPFKRTVERLKSLDLSKYEARCFTALVAISNGTAREISEYGEVPRTRVYDAMESLESRGLVEIHYTSPRRYRPIDYETAVDRLFDQYKSRFDDLESGLEELSSGTVDSSTKNTSSVWNMCGTDTIDQRIDDISSDAHSLIHVLIYDDDVITDAFIQSLIEADNRGLEVAIGTPIDSVRSRLNERLDSDNIFRFPSFEGASTNQSGQDISIGRILLWDNVTLMITSVTKTASNLDERAICSRGQQNPIVLLGSQFVKSKQMD